MLNNSDFIAGLCSKQKDISQHCCVSAQHNKELCWSSWQTLLVEQARSVPVVVVVELSMGSMFQHCKGWGRIAITGYN